MFGGGSLVNFVNNQWFAKLKPSKLVVTINSLLVDLFAKLFATKIFIHPLSPNIIGDKLSHYTVF